MAPSKVLVAFVFLFSSFHFVKTTREGGSIPLVPALYIFGDSFVDGGNNPFFWPPYGIDLINGSAWIRATNGETFADFIATFLGLPLVVPYRNTFAVASSLTGVNYAWAGSGILQETGSFNWFLSDQIFKFYGTLSSNLVTTFNSVQLVEHLERSIFLVSIGINDFNHHYGPNNKNKMEPSAFAQHLLQEMSTALRTLYGWGARKFLINNMWPAGCVPYYMANQSNPLVCNDTINKMVLPINIGLPVMLKELQTKLPGTIFAHADNFKFVEDLKRNPTKYGITNTTGKCHDDNMPRDICPNRDSYLYFDGFHPTQAANRVFARNCFNGTLCQPNIIHLVTAN